MAAEAAQSAKAGAPEADETYVSPEMIEAGLSVLFENYPDSMDGGAMDRRMVAEMYRAMKRRLAE